MKTNGLSGRRGGRARETERERERRVGDGEHCGSVSLVTRLFPHKPSGWTFAGINGSELTIFIAIVFGLFAGNGKYIDIHRTATS